MKVMAAYGKKIENVGKCHKVKIKTQEYNLESDFFAVPLGGVDIVLESNGCKHWVLTPLTIKSTSSSSIG